MIKSVTSVLMSSSVKLSLAVVDRSLVWIRSKASSPILFNFSEKKTTLFSSALTFVSAHDAVLAIIVGILESPWDQEPQDYSSPGRLSFSISEIDTHKSVFQFFETLSFASSFVFLEIASWASGIGWLVTLSPRPGVGSVSALYGISRQT